MKGRTDMAIAPDSLPVVTVAENVPGPAQGQWTYKDYLTIPDDGHRNEIVDGVLFISPSPNRWHQNAVGRVFAYLLGYIESTELGEVFVAPFDVELALDTVVQPDVIIILNANQEKITDSCIVGAPDLVIEVASPGTASYDRHRKLSAYERAGVPEYWIVDAAAHNIEVLVLQGSEYQTRGVFQGKSLLPSKVVPGFPISIERIFA